MDTFPANSQKAKATEAPREPVKPVTSAETRGRKRGLGRQLKDTFIRGTGKDAFSYMLEDVVIPAVRDTVHEAIQGGLERLIYGDRSTTRRPAARSGLMSQAPGQVRYDSISRPTQAAPARKISPQARARHEFSELVIANRQDANEVLDRMFDITSQYGEVSVADLYGLTNVEASHTDMKWGWKSLQGARVVRLRDGQFLLDLPEPQPLA
jgi:hypothetical protein